MSIDQEPQYHSRFGGLWTDRSDATVELDRRVDSGEISAGDGELLSHWISKGYAILPAAVPVELCTALRTELANAWQFGDGRLLTQQPASRETVPVGTGIDPDRMRVVDMYAASALAAEVLMAPAITGFLRLIFEQDPLLFQGLTFERGSQQGLHQDTAYVVVDSPVSLAAAWIALEDVTAGSGELMYLEGSHRLPEYLFSGEHKHWSPERDGQEQHSEWALGIVRNADRLGMTRRTFLPKAGDALIWSADLAHGGSPVERPGTTRRSMVGHYCPIDVKPNYFGYRADRNAIVRYGDGSVSSEYYDVAASKHFVGDVTGYSTADVREASRSSVGPLTPNTSSASRQADAQLDSRRLVRLLRKLARRE